MLKPRVMGLVPPAVFVLVAVGIQLGVAAMGRVSYLTQLTMSLYFAIVIVSLSLVMGYAGQVSLGHAAFFALGGYTTAVMTTANLQPVAGTGWAGLLSQAQVLVAKQDLYGASTLSFSPWVAFVAAIAGTAIIACFIGYPALRLKGHYLAMATLGFGLIVYKVLIGTAFTGAADGINGIPEWVLFGDVRITGKMSHRVVNYYIACVLALAVLVILRNLTLSRTGRALLAIHDREVAANAMGINTARYKLKAFVASAVLACIAGVFCAHYTGGVAPSDAGWMRSVRCLALVAAGGMTNIWSILAISVVINFMSLRGIFGTYDHAVFGALLVAIVSLCPEGPLEPLAAWFRRRRSRQPATEAS